MRHGFTLIEMAIVLVIIGFLASGAFIARSMFEAAELRVILSEYNVRLTAYKEFVDKYQAIPGDMTNATTYWYTDSGCPDTPTNTTPKTPTCNGDGNGTIGDWTNGATTGGSEREWFRAWQHLANASLIEGSFTGVKGATSTEAVPGVNVPLSKTGKAGWMMLYMVSDGTTDTEYFTSATSSHVMIYGAKVDNAMSNGGALVPLLGYNIDSKVDDGVPYTGNIRVKKAPRAILRPAAHRRRLIIVPPTRLPYGTELPIVIPYGSIKEMVMKHSQHGFTLIEAAMVLGTVAVVASGVLATRSIIRTAQIQSVMGEYQLYTSALKTSNLNTCSFPAIMPVPPNAGVHLQATAP